MTLFAAKHMPVVLQPTHGRGLVVQEEGSVLKLHSTRFRHHLQGLGAAHEAHGIHERAIEQQTLEYLFGYSHPGIDRRQLYLLPAEAMPVHIVATGECYDGGVVQ